MASALIRTQVPLRLFSSWKVGGAAEYFAQPKNPLEVQEAVSWAKDHGEKVTVLSGGTNVLISDSGVNGLVICLRSMSSLQTSRTADRFVIDAEAGCRKAQVFRAFLREDLAPAEFLSGLPGDVGGGVVMNAGVSENVQPREFCEIVDWIEVVPLQGSPTPRIIPADELKYSYRHCDGWGPGVITRVGLSWALEKDAGIKERVKASAASRKARQPLELPSCGSVFVNPAGDKAGRLIESCGLKGKWFGGAQISEKHANFIVNRGEATAADIEAAIRHVQQTVLAQSGIALQTEVVFLGQPHR